MSIIKDGKPLNSGPRPNQPISIFSLLDNTTQNIEKPIELQNSTPPPVPEAQQPPLTNSTYYDPIKNTHVESPRSKNKTIAVEQQGHLEGPKIGLLQTSAGRMSLSSMINQDDDQQQQPSFPSINLSDLAIIKEKPKSETKEKKPRKPRSKPDPNATATTKKKTKKEPNDPNDPTATTTKTKKASTTNATADPSKKSKTKMRITNVFKNGKPKKEKDGTMAGAATATSTAKTSATTENATETTTATSETLPTNHDITTNRESKDGEAKKQKQTKKKTVTDGAKPTKGKGTPKGSNSSTPAPRNEEQAAPPKQQRVQMNTLPKPTFMDVMNGNDDEEQIDEGDQPDEDPIIALNIPLVPLGTKPGQSQAIFNVMKLCEDKYGFNVMHPNGKIAFDLEDLDDDVPEDDTTDVPVGESEVNEDGEVENDGDIIRKISSKFKPGMTDEEKEEMILKEIHRKKMQSNKRIGKYDLHDPFIDDEELLFEEQTKNNKEGFFVYYGPLVDENNITNPKKRLQPTPSGTTTSTTTTKRRKQQSTTNNQNKAPIPLAPKNGSDSSTPMVIAPPKSPSTAPATTSSSSTKKTTKTKVKSVSPIAQPTSSSIVISNPLPPPTLASPSTLHKPETPSEQKSNEISEISTPVSNSTTTATSSNSNKIIVGSFPPLP